MTKLTKIVLIEKPDKPDKSSRKSKHSLKFAKKACLGKIKHKSMLSAEYVLNRMYGRDVHLLEIYRCVICKNFHIGHNNLKINESKKI